MNDTISRQAAIDALEKEKSIPFVNEDGSIDPFSAGRQNQWYRDGIAIMNLPPAEPEPIRINLNEPIKVKLTDLGKDIYYHQYDRINQTAGREICKPRFPKEDEHGYTEFQLWYFIELYGMHIGNVIEPLEIVYERRTDE